MAAVSSRRSLTPAFSISAYCVSNWLSASTCLFLSMAAGLRALAGHHDGDVGVRVEPGGRGLGPRDDHAGRGHVVTPMRLALEVA